MKRWPLLLIGLGACTLASCAAGPNPLTKTAGEHGIAGFWLGLWHGMICPISFVISLFKPGVSIYEVHNTGWPYNAAFIIGAGAWGVLGRSSNKEAPHRGH